MKTIKLLAVCCLTMCLFSACGGITVKGVDGTEYKSYQDACRNGDFEAAYKFVAALEEKSIEDDKYEKKAENAKVYILKQEVLFLAMQKTDEDNRKLLILLNEHDRTYWPIEELVQIAITQDNNDLLYHIAKQNISRSDEVLNRLAEIKEEKYCKVMIEMIVFNRELPHPDIGLHKYHDALTAQGYINKQNNECRKVLNLAIKAGNDSLALKVLPIFTQDIVIYEGGNDVKRPDGTWAKKAPNGMWIDCHHCYVAKYTNTSKTEAQNTYKEAVRNGVFK